MTLILTHAEIMINLIKSFNKNDFKDLDNSNYIDLDKNKSNLLNINLKGKNHNNNDYN